MNGLDMYNKTKLLYKNTIFTWVIRVFKDLRELQVKNEEKQSAQTLMKTWETKAIYCLAHLGVKAWLCT